MSVKTLEAESNKIQCWVVDRLKKKRIKCSECESDSKRSEKQHVRPCVHVQIITLTLLVGSSWSQGIISSLFLSPNFILNQRKKNQTKPMASRDKKPAKPSSSSRAGGIRTLSDLNRRSGPDSDSDSDSPQEYYTGGEKRSSLFFFLIFPYYYHRIIWWVAEELLSY